MGVMVDPKSIQNISQVWLFLFTERETINHIKHVTFDSSILSDKKTSRTTGD
jgi:hypothetical protein